MNLWEIIESLTLKPLFDPNAVEEALGMRLVRYVEPSNDAFDFFQGPGFPLDGGSELQKVSLRLGRTNPVIALLMLDITGACIQIEEVRQHYPLIEMTERPRGRSLDEAKVFSTTQSWGRLSFGFRERNPQCLSFVVFATV
jgi:hypothetical protein